MRFNCQHDIQRCKKCVRPPKPVLLDADQYDESELEFAPSLPARTPNTIYKITENGSIRIRWWTGTCLYCVHKKAVSLCDKCKLPPRPKTTLDESHPHLQEAWVEEVNGLMEAYSTSSNRQVTWKCSKGHIYKSRVADRTRQNKPSGCGVCHVDSIRIHDKDALNAQRKRGDSDQNSVKIGDDTEIYIQNLLQSHDDVESVERIGFTGDKADLVVQLRSFAAKKSLQIKSLSNNSSRPTTCMMHNDRTYADDMLLAMVDRTRTHFALGFYRELKDKARTISINFNVKPRHISMMFTREEDFVAKLVDLLKQSVDYTESVGISTAKEQQMLQRLHAFCVANNFSFKRNDTNGNTIDCFINDKAIQAKFSSKPHNGATFRVNASKSAGHLDGKVIQRPYCADDPFEFVIVEVGGTRDDEEKFLGQFCFLPKSELVVRKILSSDECDGKLAMQVCPPDFAKAHWSKKFWGNIDALKNDASEDTMQDTDASSSSSSAAAASSSAAAAAM